MRGLIFLVLFAVSCSQNPEYYYKRGNTFFMNGDYFKALDMYTKSILIKPNYPEALVSRALTYEKIGNKEKAKDDYLKAISVSSNYLPAYNNLASLLIESKLYNDALYYVDKALSINPNYYYAFYNRGLINYYTKNYEQSVKDFSKAIEISPKELAYYYRALAHYKLGDLQNALSDLEAIEKNASSDLIFYQMAKIKFENSDSSALKYITKAIEIKEDPSYYFLRARINAKSNNMENAANDINFAIKLSTMSNSTYIYYAGDIYFHLGNKDNAKKYYDMALKVNPESENIYQEKIRKLENKDREKSGRK
ncbi:MAG: tetratricopeptide repeat protein [Elusimicrobiales bacterium]